MAEKGEYMQQYSPNNTVSDIIYQSETSFHSQNSSGKSSPDLFYQPNDFSTMSVYEIYLKFYSLYGDHQLFEMFKNSPYFWEIFSVINLKKSILPS